MEKVTQSSIDLVLSTKALGVVGVSRNEQKFGTQVYRQLKNAQYRVYGVNPNLAELEGEPVFASVAALPADVEALVLVVPPAVTLQVVQEAAKRGIKAIWMQQGSESEAAITFCREQGITVVYNQCVMMFTPPVKGIHKFHRGFKQLFGGMPT